MTLNCQQKWDWAGPTKRHYFRELARAWSLGLRNNAPAEPSEVDQWVFDRLFDDVDTKRPNKCGLAMSKRDVACLLDEAYPTDITGSPPEARVTSHPCHFKYTQADGKRYCIHVFARPS